MDIWRTVVQQADCSGKVSGEEGVHVWGEMTAGLQPITFSAECMTRCSSSCFLAMDAAKQTQMSIDWMMAKKKFTNFFTGRGNFFFHLRLQNLPSEEAHVLLSLKLVGDGCRGSVRWLCPS